MASGIGVGFLKGFNGIDVDFHPSQSLVITKVPSVIRNEPQETKNKVFTPQRGSKVFNKNKKKNISVVRKLTKSATSTPITL